MQRYGDSTILVHRTDLKYKIESDTTDDLVHDKKDKNMYQLGRHQLQLEQRTASGNKVSNRNDHEHYTSQISTMRWVQAPVTDTFAQESVVEKRYGRVSCTSTASMMRYQHKVQAHSLLKKMSTLSASIVKK